MFAAYANYWDFKGRANRSEYWLYGLWTFILSVIAAIIDYVAFHDTSGFGPCALFSLFANLIPSFSVGFRRLHDTNRTAWWTLLYLIPILGWLVLFVFSVMAGTRGENRFGPPPGGRSYEELEATFA